MPAATKKYATPSSFDGDDDTNRGATLGDSTEAYELFCQSAAQGNANGEYALGLWYYLGDGGESDYEQALHWIRKATEQGNEEAQEPSSELLTLSVISFWPLNVHR